MISYSNPGYLRVLGGRDGRPLLELFEKAECFEICPECEIIKPARSKHCDVC